MKCDQCGKVVDQKDNIFDKSFSEERKIAVHQGCAKKVGGLDYFHGLRHTAWPDVPSYNVVKKILGKEKN